MFAVLAAVARPPVLFKDGGLDIVLSSAVCSSFELLFFVVVVKTTALLVLDFCVRFGGPRKWLPLRFAGPFSLERSSFLNRPAP